MVICNHKVFLAKSDNQNLSRWQMLIQWELKSLLHCLLNGTFKDIHEHFEICLFWSSHPDLIHLNLLGIRYSEHVDVDLHFTLWNSFAYGINNLWSSKVMAQGSCANTDLYFILLTVLLRFVYFSCKKKRGILEMMLL